MDTEGFDHDDETPLSTLRSHGWPCLRQFCVFMENRVGRLNELLRHLEQARLRIVALSIANSVDCAIARVLVNDTERARELFQLSHFAISENDLVGVELPDDPQPYVRICMALLRAEVNIHYTYPLLFRRQGRGAIALNVDDIDLALRTLSDQGHRLITEDDLLDETNYL